MKIIEREVEEIQNLLKKSKKDKIWALCIGEEPIISIVSQYGETRDWYYIEISTYQGLRLFNKARNYMISGFFPILNPCNGTLTDESKIRLLDNLKAIKKKVIER